MRCCQNKTSFSWSYRDSSKRSLENNVKSRRGKRKIHTLEMGGHVQMAKSDPDAQRKSSLSDCTWLENEYGSFNLEALKFLMHFREPGSSLYFYIIHTHIFFSFSYFFLYTHFFLLLSFFFSFIHFFYLLPLNSKIALYLPPPPCLDVCSSSSKEVIEIR
jgi:cellulose synthase/poly-beta-1,6-N-acetylglucosamine synthase-like glycosyltransferase